MGELLVSEAVLPRQPYGGDVLTSFVAASLAHASESSRLQPSANPGKDFRFAESQLSSHVTFHLPSYLFLEVIAPHENFPGSIRVTARHRAHASRSDHDE